MPHEAFKFKQFEVAHDQCAMKVNTDAVLLGAWVKLDNEQHILDVGTGTGLIALMLAQRSKAKIDAIDIDHNACMQAQENINSSPWKNRINIFHTSLQKFFPADDLKYDLIVSNPPFFIDSFKACSEARNVARHTNETLSFDDLIRGTKRLLKPYGRFCLILPCREAMIFRDKAEFEGLFLNYVTHVRTRKDKPEKRTMLELEFTQKNRLHSEFIIQNESLEYSDQYIELTKEFFLHDLSAKEMMI